MIKKSLKEVWLDYPPGERLAYLLIPYACITYVLFAGFGKAYAEMEHDLLSSLCFVGLLALVILG